MFLKTIQLFLLITLTAFNAYTIKPQSGQPYKTQKRINVGGGSEDFILDTIVGNRLLISCDERRKDSIQGSIWVHNLNSSTAYQLPFEPKLNFDFHPHGVSFILIDEVAYLFVINHRTKNSTEIDRFIVQKEHLILDHRFTNIIGTPNDLYAITANEYYYSDYKLLGGSIVHYNGEYRKIVKHQNYPNGVYIENNTLFFSTTINGHLYKVDLNTHKKQKLAKVKGADNIMEHSNEELLLTSHPKFIKFAKHAINSLNNSPSVVYKANKNDKEKELVFYDNGSKISATSTALYYKGKLYLCQVFEPFILVVE